MTSLYHNFLSVNNVLFLRHNALTIPLCLPLYSSNSCYKYCYNNILLIKVLFQYPGRYEIVLNPSEFIDSLEILILCSLSRNIVICIWIVILKWKRKCYILVSLWICVSTKFKLKLCVWFTTYTMLFKFRIHIFYAIPRFNFLDNKPFKLSLRMQEYLVIMKFHITIYCSLGLGY
jgi:hypothetical protein